MELKLSRVPVAKAEMLIRKPADEVYEAFVDPAITTRFWFTRSSGRLELGKPIRWDWDMYGISARVVVKALEPGRRIVIEWGDEKPTTVEWTFIPKPNNTTFVSITNSGFHGEGDSIVDDAIGSSTGFTMVLAGLKAYLEHGIQLNLIADRFPDQVASHPKPEPSTR